MFGHCGTLMNMFLKSTLRFWGTIDQIPHSQLIIMGGKGVQKYICWGLL